MWLTISKFNLEAEVKQLHPSKLGYTIDTFNGKRIRTMQDYARMRQAAREAVAGKAKQERVVAKLCPLVEPKYPYFLLIHVRPYAHIMATLQVTAGNSINYHVAKTSQKTNNAASKTPEVASAKSRQSMDMRTLAYDAGSKYPYARIVEAVSKEILSVASPEDTFFPWHVEMQLQRVCAMCTSEAQVVRRTRDLLHEWLSAPSKSRDNGLLLTGITHIGRR